VRPTVGVVIPVHNAAHFVSQALASVASQDHPPDAVAVVDDGSSDGSVAEIERWKGLLPMRVERHPESHGPALARRTAISLLETDLIALLDADDIWLPDHLRVLTRVHEERGGLVSARALKWTPGTGLKATSERELHPIPEDGQLEKMIIMNFVFGGVLFARSLYDAVGGFREEFRWGEDWDLWLRMARAGAHVAGPSATTYLYRIHPGMASNDDESLIANEIGVLEAFIRETSDPRLVAMARRSLRHRHCRLALRQSYAKARAGGTWTSRKLAVRGLRGPSGVKVRAAAMILAPGKTVGARDRRQERARTCGG
jgi:GT2 family glycosyltransferase